MATGKIEFLVAEVISCLFQQRKQRDVRKTNESYTQLVNQALPIEVQQEAEKERLSREKGSFSPRSRTNQLLLFRHSLRYIFRELR